MPAGYDTMFKNKILKAAILYLIVGLTACSQESAPTTEEKKPEYEGIIMAIGDSLTEGFGIDESLSYPALLERKLFAEGFRYQVINAGISGETSSGALSRIKWALTTKPDIVILVTGANDGLRGIDPGLVKSNITQMIQMLKDRDVIVVLGGMQMVQNLGQNYTDAFSEIYPQIAREQEIIYIPFFLAGTAGAPELNQADGIHPTAEGYQIIVNNIYPYVLEAIEIHRTRS
jgi:acyl-CoA thioesterase-1